MRFVAVWGWMLLVGWGVSQVAQAGEDPWEERPDWAAHFGAAAEHGTIVLLDERGDTPVTHVFGAARAKQRFTPASTFKIPHALMALEAGVVRDEFQVFSWDGVARTFEAWNRDQDLRSSMRGSVVWVYQWMAAAIGPQRAAEDLQRLDYGNAQATGGDAGYWLDGDLAISAVEQVAFLQKLYRNDLPMGREHQRLVKDILVVEAGRDWILRAKTGWSGPMGWWVGWVEWPSGPVFFALNIDTPQRMADLPQREAITRAILRSLDALPAE